MCSPRKQMMYQSSLVAAIKVGGKVLKEFENKVYLPYGSEYKIYLKNLDPSRRVKVEVEIDGSSGQKALVLDPKQEFSLDRFLSTANKLKFIERTETIENHRGIKASDGLVVLTYCFEALALPAPHWHSGITLDSMPVYGALNYPPGVRGLQSYDTPTAALNSVQTSTSGITVPGGESKQSFRNTTFKESTDRHVLTFELLGESPYEVLVTEPVSTRAAVECPTCGHKEKIDAKFCSECGTSLKLYR